MPICPSCEKGTLSPIIKSKPYLIIKESVTDNEINSDTVFTLQGKSKWNRPEHTTSFYLQKELGIAGLQMGIFSLTNLYMHIPPKSKKSKDEKEVVQGCIDYSITSVVTLAWDMKIILLMGAEVIKTFTGYNASDVYGLACSSKYFPNVPVIIPAPNSDKLMNSPIGEMRNALKVLKQQIQIYEEYKEI